MSRDQIIKFEKDNTPRPPLPHGCISSGRHSVYHMVAFGQKLARIELQVGGWVNPTRDRWVVETRIPIDKRDRKPDMNGLFHYYADTLEEAKDVLCSKAMHAVVTAFVPIMSNAEGKP